MGARLSCRILGGLSVEWDGVAVALGGAKQQMVLGRLLLDPGRVVPADTLVDWVWGEEASPSASATLQVYMSNLRRALAPAAAGLDRQLLVTQRPGYLARVEPEELDVSRFESGLAEAERCSSPSERVAALRDALAEWRGAPLDGLPLPIEGVAPLTRLQLVHDSAVHALLEAELASGRHREVLGELESWLGRRPLDERLRALHMIALYRAGRQADALASYQQARELLADELGLDPSPELRAVEAQVLAHDPALAAPSSGSPTASARPVADDGSATVLRSSVLAPLARIVVDGREVVLDRTVTTLGRAPDRTIVLDDPSVSRRHAEIRLVGSEATIVDVGSSNGVVVNGQRVSTTTLRDGDEIRLGGCELVFRTTA